jgi:hypothetical protein
MTGLTELATALRAHAGGVYSLQAAAELLISHRTWLRRADFRGRFIHHGASITDGLTTMAEIDWPAAITALDYGDLPCSSSEQQMLRLAASIADGLPVDLRDALTGLDENNINLVITAVLRTCGLPRPAAQAAALPREVPGGLDATNLTAAKAAITTTRS